MMIPPRFLDEIRSRVNVSEVVGRRVKLTRAGREFKGCCPFHHEKTPSFTVNDDKQFYHCFGCGAHGDVIKFVMQQDNLSFVDAVDMLAAQAGLQMPKPDPQAQARAEKAKGLHEMMDMAAGWLQGQLDAPSHRDVREYLQNRGISAASISAFRVGFAPDDGQALRRYLKEQGFTDAQMMEAGLLKKSERAADPYAFFRGRVMFPVGDRRGRIVAFGGRILPEHMRPPSQGDFKPPKYINTSDTALFDKGRTLYAESFARQAARDGQTVLVTEGYMDVIACHQAGFRGAVAPMGTALTEEQIASLWGMIPQDEKVPVLCFDGDNAGRQAAGRACERILPLLGPGKSARFAFLPEGEDPDSLIKSGGAGAFQAVLDSAISLFDFIWLAHTAGREFTTPEAKAGVVRAMQNQILEIADRDVQIYYQEQLKSRVSETFFPRRERNFRPGPPKPSAVKPAKPVFRDIYGRALLAAVINHPHVFEQAEEPLSHLEISHNSHIRLRDAVISALAAEPGLDRDGLRHHLEDQGFAKEMSDILCESVYLHAAFAGPDMDSGAVAEKWLELWHSMQNRHLQQEVRQGWKRAFDASSEEEEDRVRHIMSSGEAERLG